MQYLVWLQCVLGAANPRAAEIIQKYGTAESIYKKRDSFSSGELFTNLEIQKMKNIGLDTAQQIVNDCKKSGIEIIGITNSAYPEMLLNIDAAPLVIYIKGKMPDFDNTPSICIVGPRIVSEFGAKAAFSLASRLSRAGFIIVSGGAVGSDTSAHMGALKYNGVTVLVMGCGINYNYLPQNTKMREQITENGCLISEYPPDAPGLPHNFPVRNRIMSALSHGTVVIEAGERSGALITAYHANEQGKDVFVIPGNPTDRQYTGSNALLRDGARPLLDASDIFNEYLHRFPDKINVEKAFSVPSAKKDKKISPSGLSKEAKIVYNQLDKQNFLPDDLNTGLSAEELLSSLTELEISGYIRSLPGGRYSAVK